MFHLVEFHNFIGQTIFCKPGFGFPCVLVGLDPLDQVFLAAGDCIFATGEYVLDKVPIGIIRRPGGGGGGRGARGARGGRVHHKEFGGVF